MKLKHALFATLIVVAAIPAMADDYVSLESIRQLNTMSLESCHRPNCLLLAHYANTAEKFIEYPNDY